MTGEDYNLSWVCSYHLVCGEEIGDFNRQATLSVESVSNLDRWHMLKCTRGHEFHCVSSRNDQLHTGKSDIEGRIISVRTGFPLSLKR